MDFEVVARGIQPIVPVCDFDEAKRVDADASAVKFVVFIVLSELVVTIIICVLAADAHEAAFLVWDIESQQQFLPQKRPD